ncbi:MAG: hypothetical protein JWN50_73 [Parcubacteria group bacterium]|nr:hypothetical protein [Parcubacteria group bacterium]
MRKEKGFIFSLVLIAIGAFLGWKAYEAIKAPADTPAATTVQGPSTATSVRGSIGPDYTPTDETSSTDVSTWKTYSVLGGLASFKYPSDWTLKGTTLASAKGGITIRGAYAKGSLPSCDPANCTTGTVNGLAYTRTAVTSGTNTTLVYRASKLGYIGTATAIIATDPKQLANIALVDEIVGTINVK